MRAGVVVFVASRQSARTARDNTKQTDNNKLVDVAVKTSAGEHAGCRDAEAAVAAV